ncbi:MAG: type II toxin-antitoxin system PemK/MazF family toxin [Clostridia bacterium]|nr:type II toxin-antitoxin system PemK/MazF family toxin [Clostridia bacterium]
MKIRRGDIFFADLTPVKGSEQDGVRPVLIIQNDIGNKYSPTVIGIPITTSIKRITLPTHVPIYSNITGIPKDSMILVEQIRTLDKSRLKSKIGVLDKITMNKVKEAIKKNFNIRYSFDDLFEDW